MTVEYIFTQIVKNKKLVEYFTNIVGPLVSLAKAAAPGKHSAPTPAFKPGAGRGTVGLGGTIVQLRRLGFHSGSRHLRARGQPLASLPGQVQSPSAPNCHLLSAAETYLLIQGRVRKGTWGRGDDLVQKL